MAKEKFTFYRPHKRVREHGELADGTVPPSLTKQEFVRECDINTIIKQYSATGMLSHVSAKAQQGAYQDLPDSYDFQESLNLVNQAEAAFMSLPAKLRERFDNEPGQFLAFCSDPANLDEMRALGLANPLPPAPPPEPPPAPPPTPENTPPDATKKPG